MNAIRLMLVDDEVRLVETLGKRLASRGLDVEGVSSAREALDLLEKRAFDVILLDVRMPGMDGIAALREIKRIQPLAQVILLSGNASVNAAVEGMRLGASEFLLKPLDLDTVLARVEEAYEKKRLEEEKARMDR